MPRRASKPLLATQAAELKRSAPGRSATFSASKIMFALQPKPDVSRPIGSCPLMGWTDRAHRRVLILRALAMRGAQICPERTANARRSVSTTANTFYLTGLDRTGEIGALATCSGKGKIHQRASSLRSVRWRMKVSRKSGLRLSSRSIN